MVVTILLQPFGGGVVRELPLSSAGEDPVVVDKGVMTGMAGENLHSESDESSVMDN